MPDAHGSFKGISVPRLPWIRDDEETPPVTEQEDEVMSDLHERLEERRKATRQIIEDHKATLERLR